MYAAHYRRIVPLTDYTRLRHTKGASQFAVAEQFFSPQGEGVFVGTPAWFIRLQGCQVGCPWCDTKETWPSGEPSVALADLVRGIPQSARHVVVTGGEPFEQDIRRLLWALYLEGRSVQVETSGCYDVYGPAWITVSPKFFKPLSVQALRAAHEIKQVVASDADIARLREKVIPHVSAYTPVSLQPVSNGQRALEICLAACRQYGYRLSVQTHKLLGLP